MTISSISAASLSQYVLSSSDSSPLQLALQTLQNSLASGDLNAARSAFQTLQQLNQSLVTASGSSASSSSQLSTDLTALGSALSSGDLSTAQSAFCYGAERPEKRCFTIANSGGKCRIPISAVGRRIAQLVKFDQQLFFQRFRHYEFPAGAYMEARAALTS